MAIAPAQLINAAVEKGLIDRDAVTKLRVESRRQKEDLMDTILNYGQFPLSSLYRAYAETRQIPFIELNQEKALERCLKKLPENIVRRRLVLPIGEEEDKIVVAAADPDDKASFDLIKKILGQSIKTVLAEPIALKQLIEQTFSELKKDIGVPLAVPIGTTDSVVLMDNLMKEAFLRRSSDIHIEPQENTIRIRFRIDGSLQMFNMGINVTDGHSLISRIKVLASLDISEQRATQDGGFTYTFPHQAKRKIDIRVATAPTRWGERVTLRLLGLETEKLTLTSLGMSPKDLEKFRCAIARPFGVILLTGPTGSGKTTTLYGALREINRPQINIMTIEDPLEYVISGINQLQVGSGTKTTFASALRALLRHDPDVLMIGEIRDYETADIALKASLTGHLVFSTLHTNSAVSAITRLINIGCEQYLIGSSLTAIIAQRLARRLCSKCKKSRNITSEEKRLLGFNESNQKIYEPVGCIHCMSTGYRGRVGIFELLWLDEELRNAISGGKSQKALLEMAKSKGFVSLREDGYSKVLEGLTSLDEILTLTVME